MTERRGPYNYSGTLAEVGGLSSKSKYVTSLFKSKYPFGSIQRLAMEPEHDAAAERRVQKRLMWLDFALKTFPLPVLMEYHLDLLPLDVDASIPKRTWEKLSKKWMIRRRLAFAQYAYYAGGSNSAVAEGEA